MFRVSAFAFCLSVLSGYAAVAQRAVVQSPDFCRALHAVTEGPRTSTRYPALPGFTLQQSSAANVFRTESVFIDGNDLNLLPSRVAQCAPEGRWINILQPSPDPGRADWYRAMWGLPNGVNVSMSMQYSPTARNTITVVSFAIRAPELAAQTAVPSSRQSVKPKMTAYRFKCPDGHIYQHWSTGMRDQIVTHLRVQGTCAVQDLPINEGRTSENSSVRIRMGSGGAGWGFWNLRNGKVTSEMECPDIDPVQIDDY